MNFYIIKVIVVRTILAIRVLILRSFPVFRTAARGGTFGLPKSTQKPDGALPLYPGTPNQKRRPSTARSLNIDRVAGLGAKRHQAGAAALPSVWKQGSNTPLSLAGDGGFCAFGRKTGAVRGKRGVIRYTRIPEP